MAHRFRFFTAETPDAGDVVELAEADARHMHVIRAQPGDVVDLVDRRGHVYDAEVLGTDGQVRVVQLQAQAGTAEPEIVLYAGVLTGQPWDHLVDGAVQAGVSRIVPVAFTQREGDQLRRRGERIMRVAESAAKQSKRTYIPRVEEPMAAQLLGGEPRGIVLDPGAELSLVDWRPWDDGPYGLIVGGASGIPRAYVKALVDRGWVAARIGDSVLRSELAAAIGVAIVRARCTDR